MYLISDPYISNPASILPPTTGLVSWWKFDEIAGTMAYDSSSVMNNLTIDSAPTWIAGKKNGAVYFQSDYQWGYSSNPAEIQIGIGTISLWVNIPTNPTSSSGYIGLMVKQLAYALFLVNGKIGFYDWGGGGARISTVGLTENTWQNITMTFQSGVANGTKIYLDNVLILTTTMTVSSQSNGVAIGSGSVGGSQRTPCKYDQALIYNRVLTDAEIAIISK